MKSKYLMPPQNEFWSFRYELNLSLEEVAEKCNTSIGTISRLENGKNIHYSTAKKIFDYYSRERNER